MVSERRHRHPRTSCSRFSTPQTHVRFGPRADIISMCHFYVPFRIWAWLHLSRHVATAIALFLVSFAPSSVDRTTVRALFHLLASAWLLPQCAEGGNTGASATGPPRDCGRRT